MATIWSDEETFKLIEPWPLGDDYMHEQLNKSKRNAYLSNTASEIKDAG